MDDKQHWETVYTTKGPDRVGWFRPHLDWSLAFLDTANTGHAAQDISKNHPGYWHCEQSHAKVISRSYSCSRCHSDLYPIRKPGIE